ncbi:MAG: hypothetical protein ACKVJQ_12235 [Alphaproteobacteria bacterium]
MKMRFVSRLFAVLVLMGLPGARSMAAEPASSFVGAVEAAYPHYRMAWFYTRMRSGDVALLELDRFREQWTAINARFKNAPPARFASDPRWRETLDRVTAALSSASALGDKGKLRSAYKALSPIRRELSQLRTRNGITTFTDLVEAGAADVAELSRLRRNMVVDDALIQKMKVSVDRFRGVINRVRENAPKRYAKDEGFQAAIAGNLGAIGLLERGLKRRHKRAIHGSISSIRSDYNLLFIRYG